MTPAEVIAAVMPLVEKTPFNWRRSIDKTDYVVIRADNADWLHVVSDERTIMGTWVYEETAKAHCDRLRREWRAQQIVEALAIAGFSIEAKP